MGNYLSNDTVAKLIEDKSSFAHGSRPEELPKEDPELAKLIEEAKIAKAYYMKDLKKLEEVGQTRSTKAIAVRCRIEYLSGIISMGRYANGNYLNLDHMHPYQQMGIKLNP